MLNTIKVMNNIKMMNNINGCANKTMGKNKARHILDLSTAEKKEFLDSFDLVLSDCDGVIWMLVEPIPNSGVALQQLKNAGKQVKFVSNNSMRTDDEYMSKLANIGVSNVIKADLVHPVKTITRYIKKHKLSQPVYCLCSSEMNEVLIENGIKILTMEHFNDLKDSDLLRTVKPTDKVGAVVIDLDFNLTYSQLARAAQYLLDPECPMLVGASDVRVPVSKDFITIGSAGFIDILRTASGKEPTVLGKPGLLLGDDLVEQFKITHRNRALFIGDNLVNDIQFAATCGFKSLFVLSGANTMEQMLQLPNAVKPDYIANSLADIITLFDTL